MAVKYGILLLSILAWNGFRIGVASANESPARAAIVAKLPLFLLLLASESDGGVWIPDEPADDTDGSVASEYSEVATVFAKPDTKIVQPEVVQPSNAGQPWTSLKQEWDLYNKFHGKKVSEDSSEESSEEREDEQKLPQAFYGQQNNDDDERDFSLGEKILRHRTKQKLAKDESSSEEDYDDNEFLQDDLNNIPDVVREAMISKLLASKTQGGGNPVPYQDEGESSSESQESPQADISPLYEKGDSGELDLPQSDHGGKGKKGKKKKKKKGKGGHGWGWKKPIIIPVPAPPEHGWKKHDGLLEQLVKGSTWERVLAYYHQQNDDAAAHEGWGWKQADLTTTLHHTGQQFLQKLFKGSFWERAFQTYSNYKRQNQGKGAKDVPLSLDWS